MPIVSVERIDGDATLEQVIDAFAKLQKAFDYLMQGGLDSKNAKEFGGWLVGLTELQSRDKTVGMSTDHDDVDPIRFWAGDLKEGTPKFKVTEAGIMTAIAAIFMSAAGFPMVSMNLNNNLIQAFSDADNHVDISPTIGGSPGIGWIVAGVLTAYLNTTSAGPLLASFAGTPITFQSSSNINLSPSGNLNINGSSGKTVSLSYVKNIIPDGFGGFTANNGTLTFTKGILTSNT